MKISIITINYNNKDGLKNTIESVRKQSDKNFEYIIIDGGSTDGSVDIIKNNEDIIRHWVSERDKGIYNAMNKGVTRARGKYCLFLNSGDVLHDSDVIGKVNKCREEADILFGNVCNISADGKKHMYVPSTDMTLLLIMETGIHHAGSFIKTELMHKYPYDETLRICADRKFFIQSLVIDNCNYHNLSFTVCDFELGGISSTNLDLARKEKWEVMNSLFPPRLVADYRKTNVRIQNMTAMLVKSRHKIVTLICGLDKCILKLLKLVLRNRFSQNI